MPDSPTPTGENDRPPKDPELVALGSRIRELRAAAGKTQERVAADAGIHWTYVGQVERGERNPSFKNLMKLARGLDTPLAEVLGGL
jgi:transcriptional regulator with XRE-family HTH domain